MKVLFALTVIASLCLFIYMHSAMGCCILWGSFIQRNEHLWKTYRKLNKIFWPGFFLFVQTNISSGKFKIKFEENFLFFHEIEDEAQIRSDFSEQTIGTHKEIFVPGHRQ